jgi:O-acetyl-ADP-ribose deacetylase (regulator of RNase III)
MDKSYVVGTSSVSLRLGDITHEDTEAIVNAASERLLGGGGVDGAIHAAAGPALLAACRQAKATLRDGKLPAGRAVITRGFNLRARWVIHTVGPVYGADPAAAPALLASAITQSLARARDAGCESIAFPAISTGAFGYPLEEAAEVSIKALRDDLLKLGRIKLARFVLFDVPAFDAFARVADREL